MIPDYSMQIYAANPEKVMRVCASICVSTSTHVAVWVKLQPTHSSAGYPTDPAADSCGFSALHAVPHVNRLSGFMCIELTMFPSVFQEVVTLQYDTNNGYALLQE